MAKYLCLRHWRDQYFKETYYPITDEMDNAYQQDISRHLTNLRNCFFRECGLLDAAGIMAPITKVIKTVEEIHDPDATESIALNDASGTSVVYYSKHLRKKDNSIGYEVMFVEVADDPSKK